MYDTIIRSQRQIKRFGSVNPAGGLGFRFYRYRQQGSIINATQQKALGTSVGGRAWESDGQREVLPEELPQVPEVP